MDISVYFTPCLPKSVDGNRVLLKLKDWWAPETVWMFLKTRKIFVPTRIGIPDYPASGVGAILTMLSQLSSAHIRIQSWDHAASSYTQVRRKRGTAPL
jgi:hypothetical protein